MEDVDLLTPFVRLIGDLKPIDQLRAAERGESGTAAWEALATSGFLDALVPEDCGGAGLAMREVGPLIEALGRFPLPFPIADTMIARRVLAEAGKSWPQAPILLRSAIPGLTVQHLRRAPYELIDHSNVLELVSIDHADFLPTRDADSSDRLAKANGVSFVSPASGRLREIGAMLRSAEIAGLGDRALEMSVTYANERVQFGKPIGKQQAIQQQLAQMAEKVVMTRIAARTALDCDFLPSPFWAAVAKVVASAAAAEISAIAHAVHGAIGISGEHDLQLFTKQLHQCRFAHGAEGYWSTQVGANRLTSNAATSLEFLRGTRNSK